VLERLAVIQLTALHLEAAEAAAVEAADLAAVVGDKRTSTLALRARAELAFRHGDTEEAIDLGRRALDEAADLDEALRARCLGDLGFLLVGGRHDTEAREVLHEARQAFRRMGDGVNEANTSAYLASLDLYSGAYEAALAGFLAALAGSKELGHHQLEIFLRIDAGMALIGLERRAEARAAFAQVLDLAQESDQVSSIYEILEDIALAADAADFAKAARIIGAVRPLQEVGTLTRVARHGEVIRHFEQPLVEALGHETWDLERELGAALTLEETKALARELCA
jgi:tetratricopeptide (TPR) repeat protein